MANLNYKKWRNHTSSSSFRSALNRPSTLGDGTTSVGVDVGEGDFVIFCHHYFRAFIDVFLMSQGYSLRRLKPLELAKDIGVLSPDKFRPGEQCRFVHLGGRRVCLVLSRFMGPLTGNCLAEFEKMSVFVVVFEFQVVERESLNVQVLAKRVFEYNTRRSPEYEANTNCANMLGAFLL